MKLVCRVGKPIKVIGGSLNIFSFFNTVRRFHYFLL